MNCIPFMNPDFSVPIGSFIRFFPNSFNPFFTALNALLMPEISSNFFPKSLTSCMVKKKETPTALNAKLRNPVIVKNSLTLL